MTSGKTGVVIIGRNESDRLRRCLASVLPSGQSVAYVDSGSEDGSAAVAGSMGATVVELDGSLPFTAARGRNAGFRKLLEIDPGVRFVQFVDGDCELAPAWLDAAVAAMGADPKLAAVRGHLRERNRHASIYARLCDMEWSGPLGDIRSTGGIAMFRVDAFQQAGGFDAAIMAGEEAELCRRLLTDGHRIQRIDAEMGLHDSAMTRFGQWWKRAVRAGHSFAQGAVGEVGTTDRRNRRAVCSIVFWALLLPVVAVALAWPTRGLSVLLLAGYPALWYRIARRGRGNSPGDARLYATFCVLAKFAQLLGMLRYAWNRWIRRQRSPLIEHEATAPLPLAESRSLMP